MSFYLVVSLNVPLMSMKVAGRCNILRIGYQKYLLRNVTHSLIFLEVRRDQMGGDSPGSCLTPPHLFGEGCCAAVASSAGWGPGCYRFTGRGPAPGSGTAGCLQAEQEREGSLVIQCARFRRLRAPVTVCAPTP